MKSCVGAIHNTFSPSQAKPTAKVSFSGFNAAKTLDSIPISPAEEKYFKDGVPLLAKVIHQGFFGVQKFADEASRFLATFAVANCTKLVMHDPVTNTGFLAHVDSIFKIIHPKSIENIKKALPDVNPENLLVRHLKGCCKASELESNEITLKFMESLGIPKKNLIEEDLSLFGNGASGLFLDIKTGQTYNTEKTLKVAKNDIDKYKNAFNEKEQKIFSKEQSEIINAEAFEKAMRSRCLLDING